jgi:hypothetical protein
VGALRWCAAGPGHKGHSVDGRVLTFHGEHGGDNLRIVERTWRVLLRERQVNVCSRCSKLLTILTLVVEHGERQGRRDLFHRK